MRRWLLTRDPASLDDPWGAAALLAELRAAGASEAVQALLARGPGSDVEYADAVAWLLEELRAAGAGEAVRIALARDPAGRAVLDDSGDVAWLLEELHAAGAGDALRAFLARNPGARVSLGANQRRGVARLLTALRTAGAGQAARTLAGRAANAGMFELTEDRANYPFGREPDGAAAPPWRWAEPLPHPDGAPAGPSSWVPATCTGRASGSADPDPGEGQSRT